MNKHLSFTWSDLRCVALRPVQLQQSIERRAAHQHLRRLPRKAAGGHPIPKGRLEAEHRGLRQAAPMIDGDYAGLVKTGTADAVVTYITHAILHTLPYLSLPDELDQSNPTMKEIYATARYTTPQGQTFHGTPAVYSVTIPKGSRNQKGAEAFLRYLLSAPGRAALLRRGFPATDVLVGGDETTVPESRGLKHALSVCRGHFANYSEGKGLFDKYHGQFWIPQHVRGSASQGVVTKDYAVSAPRETT